MGPLLDISREAFCQAYMSNGYNASLAYKMTHPDVTDGSSRVLASHWMKEVEIKERIKELSHDLYVNYNISAETIAAELALVAYQKHSIRGDGYNETTKLKALDLLQKQYSLQSQKIDATVNGNMAIEINIHGDETDENEA